MTPPISRSKFDNKKSFLKNLKNYFLLSGVDLQEVKIGKYTSILHSDKMYSIHTRSKDYMYDTMKILNLSKLRGLKDISFLEDFQKYDIKKFIINGAAATHLEDFSELKYLKNLNSIIIAAKGLQNIEFLKNFNNLRDVYLYNTKIEDMSVLSELDTTNLKCLRFANSNLKNINPLANVSKDIDIFVAINSEIEDISILETLNNSKISTISLSGNKITNVDVLLNLNLPRIREIFISRNLIQNKSEILKKLKEKFPYTYIKV